MRNRTPLIAICLLALWVLASHHAVFELAGIMRHAAPSAAAPGSDAGHIGWHEVEKSATKWSADLPTDMTPALHLLPLVDLVARLMPVRMSPEWTEARPREREDRAFAVRHFVERSAPLPGAPSRSA